MPTGRSVDRLKIAFRRAARAFELYPCIYGHMLAVQASTDPLAMEMYARFAERRRDAFGSFVARVSSTAPRPGHRGDERGAHRPPPRAGPSATRPSNRSTATSTAPRSSCSTELALRTLPTRRAPSPRGTPRARTRRARVRCPTACSRRRARRRRQRALFTRTWPARIFRATRCARSSLPDTAAGEPVDGVVGDLDRFFLGVVGDDREHRPEDLLLRDGHVAA